MLSTNIMFIQKQKVSREFIDKIIDNYNDNLEGLIVIDAGFPESDFQEVSSEYNFLYNEINYSLETSSEYIDLIKIPNYVPVQEDIILLDCIKSSCCNYNKRTSSMFVELLRKLLNSRLQDEKDGKIIIINCSLGKFNYPEYLFNNYQLSNYKDFVFDLPSLIEDKLNKN